MKKLAPRSSSKRSLITRIGNFSLIVNCWKQAESEKKGYFGKKGMHEESDNWKEEQDACMHGRPNDIRVRVFVIHCNG